MNTLFAKKITASAGTGKTYRLSLEYICLLLDHFRHPDFRLDNILVLTFTRKATSEIRQRILEHITLICDAGVDSVDSRSGSGMTKQREDLISTLTKLRGREFSDNDLELLSQALLQLTFDKQQLQVMTIDSYISSIFRNLVRPVRCIDDFEIDLLAVEKRLPFLLEYLMHSSLKDKLHSLLRRRISPTLEQYNDFFASLIGNRWLHHMVHKWQSRNELDSRLGSGMTIEGFNPQCLASYQQIPEATLALRTQELQQKIQVLLNEFVMLLQDRANVADAKSGDYPLPRDLINKSFADFIGDVPHDFEEFAFRIEQRISNPNGLLKFVDVLIGGKLHNGTRFRAKALQEAGQRLAEITQELLTQTANYLILTFLIPEQREILDIWASVLKEYDRLIYRYKNMTYDDIAWFSFEALYSQEPPIFNPLDEEVCNEFYQFLSHRSRFVLIDEFQDTSLLQFNILKPIIDEVLAGEGTKPFGGFIVVGDEKQSIFGWRGGERDLLVNLEKIFGRSVKFHTEPLVYSWRSSPGIMSFVNGVFGSSVLSRYLAENDLNWDYTPVTSMNKEEKTCLDFKVVNYSQYSNSKAKKPATVAEKEPDQTEPKEEDIQSSTPKLEQVYEFFINEMVLPYAGKEKETQAILCRKGKELEALQAILEDKKQGGLYQPSASLLDHKLIKPLLSFLKFMAFGDWLEFFAFLRSDYVLLNARCLKETALCIKGKGQRAEGKGQRAESGEQLQNSIAPKLFPGLPLVQAIFELAVNNSHPSIPTILQKLSDLCLQNKKLSEREYLNLHAFLQIATTFDTENTARRIPDFLTWLQDNSKQDFMLQRSVPGGGTIELQTIHKAKGLEYDRVFVFFNLSSKGGHGKRELKPYFTYTDDTLQELSDFALTLNYEHLLKHSDFQHLEAEAVKRSNLEELNTLYVAFTRAKTKLHILFCYNNKKDWEEYYPSLQKDNKVTLPHAICQACYEVYHNGLQDNPQNFATGETEGCNTSQQKQHSLPTPTKHSEMPHLKIAIPPYLKEDKPSSQVPSQPLSLLKKSILEDRKALYGDLIHNYLSYLIRNTAREQVHAFNQTVLKYGTLIPLKKIKDLTNTAQNQLPPELFEPHWDKIFTELPIWQGNRQYRIDRLMIDSKSKTALVIDFKTGGIEDEEQTETYISCLEALPAFGGYKFLPGKFVTLGLQMENQVRD